jgi:PAS domain S-box-containing protein
LATYTFGKMMQPQDQNKENKDNRHEVELSADGDSGFGLNPEKNLILTEPGEREKLIRALIEDSLEGMAIVQDFKFIYVNKAFIEMMGYSLEELNLMEPTHIISPEDKERLTTQHRRRMQGDKEVKISVASFIRKDGTKFIAEFNSSLVVIRGKEASYITLRDITERLNYERALRESEAKYKTLIENSQDGIIIVRDNKILFANNTFCRMIGYGCDILYKNTADYFIHPDDRAIVKNINKRRLTNDISTIITTFRITGINGKVLECETYSTIIDYDGIPASLITIHNLTESKRMQEALQKSEEKYRNLINKATDGIVITQNGLIKFANPAMCEMMQHSYDEMLDKPYLNYVVAEDHQVMIDYHKRRMSGEVFTSIYRSRFIRKDGSIITMELNARTSDYNGHPAAFIVIRDITERINIEKELQEAKVALEKMNLDLEKRVFSSSQQLSEANMQLIRLQKENLQSQFEVLRQQVNPHFLFNSLNVLTSLIKLEPDLAEKFTEHLSKVYRYVLENKEKDLVKLRTELEFLEAYIFLLNIRFMDKIVIKVNIGESENELMILPLALQLLIENAIKHNAMSKKNPLLIEIFIEEGNILKVVNNLQERESHMASTGLGLKNIEHRYKLLELPTPEFIKTETHFIAKVPLKNN